MVGLRRGRTENERIPEVGAAGLHSSDGDGYLLGRVHRLSKCKIKRGETVMRLTVQQHDQVCVLRREGRTLKYISGQVGCSVEGVRQVCKRAVCREGLRKATAAAVRLRTPPTKIRIDQITMSTRAFRVLSTLGVIYLSEVAMFTQREILSIRGSGRKTLVEIEDWILKPFGLKLNSN